MAKDERSSSICQSESQAVYTKYALAPEYGLLFIFCVQRALCELIVLIVLRRRLRCISLPDTNHCAESILASPAEPPGAFILPQWKKIVAYENLVLADVLRGLLSNLGV